MVTAVSDDAFDKEVLESDKPVLVDFWAEWCGPCRMLMPIVEQFAGEAGEKVKVVKVNIDENPQAPTKYGVRSIPTLMLFKDGQLAATKVGLLQKNQLQEWVDSVAA